MSLILTGDDAANQVSAERLSTTEIASAATLGLLFVVLQCPCFEGELPCRSTQSSS